MQLYISKPLARLIKTCKQYQNNELSTDDFVDLLKTFVVPTEVGIDKDLYSLLQDVSNAYDMIFVAREYSSINFTAEEEKREIEPYILDIINIAQAEIKRLKNYKPYASQTGEQTRLTDGQATQPIPQAVNA
ncbi:MAG: hypothetical protein FWG68_08100 [Defluviitaleaceae bacterium]|nr:hypothetical protein [Defluviitaleaceae bacterium]